MPDINDNDIDGLRGFLSLSARHSFNTIPSDVADRYHRALTALVAERDALRKRIEELESQQPASDLRERLLESALQGAARDAHMHHEASSMGTRAVYIVDAAIAAMRKGEA